MFFSGDFRSSKRKVDLRGNSKQQDRAQLLEQSRIEREKRQLLRVQTRAAQRVQAFVRAVQAVRGARNQARNDWVNQYGEYGELATVTDLEWASTMFLRPLLFFARASDPEDVRRLGRACALLGETTGAGRPFFCQTEDASSAGTHLERAKKLMALCFDALYYHRELFQDNLLSPCTTSSLGLANSIIKTLQLLLSPEAGPEALGRDEKSATRLLTYLCKNHLFVRMRTLLLWMLAKRPPGQSSDCPCALEATVSALVSRFLDISPVSDPSTPFSQGITAQIMSLPLLWSRQACLRPLQARMWARGVLELRDWPAGATMPLPPSPEYPSCCWLLGNLLEAARAGVLQCNSDAACAAATHAFADVVQTLLRQVPATSFPAPPGEDEDEDFPTDDISCDDSGAGRASKSNVWQASTGDLVGGSAKNSGIAWPPPPVELAQQLAHLGDVDTLQALIAQALPPPPARGSPEELSHSCTAEVAADRMRVCSLVYTALTRLPPANRAQVLNGLAFHAQLVPRLWHHLWACEQSATWLTVNQEDVEACAHWLVPVSVFCQVYSFMLMTSDDEEFHTRQVPLPLAAMPSIVHLLKTAVTMCIAVQAQKRIPSQALYRQWRFARDWTSKLLAQLHDRNCRRRFVGPEAFHAEEAVGSATAFVAEMHNEDSRARRILRLAPSLVSFSVRVHCLRQLIAQDREEVRSARAPVMSEEVENFLGSGRTVQVRRDQLVMDGFQGLNRLGTELKRTVRIQFMNELGVAEAGVDGGGLFKDFLDNLTREAFNPEHGFFKVSGEHQLYPNPASRQVSSDHLAFFEFFGRMLGKALYEGILLELPLAAFFLSKLRGRTNELNDLPSLDAELYRSLLFLKRYQGDVADLSLYFSVSDNEFGQAGQTDLIPGGRDVPVTASNVVRYIHLMANHRLNTQIHAQSMAFLRGFQDLIRIEWVKMFNEEELQMLISGSKEGLDIADLRANTAYSGGYSDSHQVIRWLWQTLSEFDADQQASFLKFVTSCSRGPLLGFQHLEPRFCIQRSGVGGSNAPDNSADMDRLPTSATCMNLLKLPPYSSQETMRSKLLYAIESGAGFDLS